MRIVLAGVGPVSKKDFLDQAAQDYAERLTHYARFELRTVEASARRGGGEPVERLEADKLRKVAPPGAHAVALQVTGRQYTTEQLAARLQAWLNAGRDVVLYQGGPTGLDGELLRACVEQWSLSTLTLPHRLARVVALEALYRAFTVLRGEPYHRA
ncbi:MAG: 23S rRNA (pseudouridine(1915)-N(3))-methyltransferase RlmH [Deltaproteobacteria bacterium]|nr:23S rRNA (pseudouridine(1915)-N(3))-methyltransferase RlmH [Deltaproteobacteria bacterium]